MTYSSDDTERPQVVSTTRARQGRWGQHVFWVLVFGTLLAALGMWAAWTWRDSQEGPAGIGSERGSGAAYDQAAPPSPTQQTSPQVPARP